MQCCHNYRKYNNSSKKNNNCHLPAVWKACKSEDSCWNLAYFKSTLLVKEIHKIGYINALNATLLMLFRKFCKKISEHIFHDYHLTTVKPSVVCYLYLLMQ